MHDSREPSRLSQLSEFHLRLFQNRDIGVGIFPECKEVLIGGACFGRILLDSIGAGEVEMGQSTRCAVLHQAAVVEDLLELGGGRSALAVGQVSLATNVNRIKAGITNSRGQLVRSCGP